MTQCNTHIAKPYLDPSNGMRRLVGKCVSSSENNTGLALINVRSNKVVNITYTPDSVEGGSVCETPCCLEWPCPEVVTLTAPASVFSDGQTWSFEYWVVDGGSPVFTTSVQVQATGCHDAIAIYSAPNCTNLCDLLPDALSVQLVSFLGEGGQVPPPYSLQNANYVNQWLYYSLTGIAVRAETVPPTGGNCRVYAGTRLLCDETACAGLSGGTTGDCFGDLCAGCPTVYTRPQTGYAFGANPDVCAANAATWLIGDESDAPGCNVTCGCNLRRTQMWRATAMHGAVSFLSVVQSGSNINLTLDGGVAFNTSLVYHAMTPATYISGSSCDLVTCSCSDWWTGGTPQISDIGGGNSCGTIIKPITGPVDSCAAKVQAVLSAFPITMVRYSTSGGDLDFAYTWQIDF
jgi:hypothetical protein